MEDDDFCTIAALIIARLVQIRADGIVQTHVLCSLMVE